MTNNKIKINVYLFKKESSKERNGNVRNMKYAVIFSISLRNSSSRNIGKECLYGKRRSSAIRVNL